MKRISSKIKRIFYLCMAVLCGMLGANALIVGLQWGDHASDWSLWHVVWFVNIVMILIISSAALTMFFLLLYYEEKGGIY